MSAVLQSNGKPNTEVKIQRKLYTGVPARLIKLLSAGIKQEEAALAAGVDPSYVSQLMGEPDFRSQVEENIEKTSVAAVEIDQNYLEVERVLSDRLKLASGMSTDPEQIVRILKFVNEAKKKVTPQAGGHEVDGVRPVILQLPNAVINNFILSPQNEVVGVDEKQLVTLNSSSMSGILQAHKVRKLTERVQTEETIIEPNLLPPEMEELNGSEPEKRKHRAKPLTNDDLNNL